jgi:MoaA/NifB/PqqE/SkfB family radical SAM enzyme
VLTGGDPLKRRDLFALIARAQEAGLLVSVAPSGTPLLTDEAIGRLKAAGVEAISLSLDGATAERHDAIRQVPGCFERTLVAARAAREAGLAFQVNTLVAAETLQDMAGIHRLVREMGAARWSLFFLVLVGRGTVLQPITAEACEQFLEWLSDRAAEPGLIVATTEAPHFRRVLRQKGRGGGRPAGQKGGGHAWEAAGIRDGNGIMFISSTGDVTPSGFLPLSAGNVRVTDPVAIYRESPLFQTLRAAEGFGGRCGICEFRGICGGSRARAWAATGDALAEDPLCLYEPMAPKPGSGAAT